MNKMAKLEFHNIKTLEMTDFIQTQKKEDTYFFSTDSSSHNFAAAKIQGNYLNFVMRYPHPKFVEFFIGDNTFGSFFDGATTYKFKVRQFEVTTDYYLKAEFLLTEVLK